MAKVDFYAKIKENKLRIFVLDSWRTRIFGGFRGFLLTNPKNERIIEIMGRRRDNPNGVLDDIPIETWRPGAVAELLGDIDRDLATARTCGYDESAWIKYRLECRDAEPFITYNNELISNTNNE